MAFVVVVAAQPIVRLVLASADEARRFADSRRLDSAADRDNDITTGQAGSYVAAGQENRLAIV